MTDPDRLRRIYAALPRRLRGAIPFSVEHWARARFLARMAGAGDPARWLEDRLWGGFSDAAVAGLEALANGDARGGTRGDTQDGAEAAWVLARWHASQGDFAAALADIRRMRDIRPETRRDRRQFVLEALFLCQRGEGAAARALLDARRGVHGFDTSAALLRASSWTAEATPPGPVATARALAGISAVFHRSGLQGVTLRRPDLPLSIDNLRGEDPGPQRSASTPRVTVILPAHNAADTLGTALASLAEQTWTNLEVLIVDDASTDGTDTVAAAFCAADPRFRLIRQAVNAGGYAARNRALAEATGDLVTVHDADDWSHPEKLSLQVRALARGGPAPNFTAWVRTTDALLFTGAARVYPDLMGLNDSSALFRRAQLARLGQWDSARIGADKELIWRIERLEGREREGFRRRMLLPDCPLAFGRLRPASLTRSAATHVLSIYHGIRRDYREAAEVWQADLDRREVARGGLDRQPPFFPAPRAIRSEQGLAPGRAHDLLFIGDFNLSGGAFHSAMHMLRAARAADLDCALLHYRRYDQDVTQPLKAAVLREAWARNVRIVSAGESLRASTVIVTYPAILQHALDRFPAVGRDRLAVVVNQMAERDLPRTDIAYDPARVRANLTRQLGGEGVWIPISARVRALMAGDPRYPAPHPDTWAPLLDLDAWCVHVPRWRRAERELPVLGRHGRDDPLKWPRDPDMIRAAYCADQPCAVRFLGGAGYARARIGRWPANWREDLFDAHDMRGFLADLDVFLHFPDRDYIEEFGRAPMEAMAVGVPVILPPEFDPTFGEAALYAEPSEVWPLVERLWRDRSFWETRVAAGRAFVRAECGYDAFPRRLARLGTADGAPAAPAPRAAARP